MVRSKKVDLRHGLPLSLCPLCGKSYDEHGHHPTALQCGHLFGSDCLKDVLASSKTCPACGKGGAKNHVRVFADFTDGDGPTHTELWQSLTSLEEETQSINDRFATLENQSPALQQSILLKQERKNDLNSVYQATIQQRSPARVSLVPLQTLVQPQGGGKCKIMGTNKVATFSQGTPKVCIWDINRIENSSYEVDFKKASHLCRESLSTLLISTESGVRRFDFRQGGSSGFFPHPEGKIATCSAPVRSDPNYYLTGDNTGAIRIFDTRVPSTPFCTSDALLSPLLTLSTTSSIHTPKQFQGIFYLTTQDIGLWSSETSQISSFDEMKRTKLSTGGFTAADFSPVKNQFGTCGKGVELSSLKMLGQNNFKRTVTSTLELQESYQFIKLSPEKDLFLLGRTNRVLLVRGSEILWEATTDGLIDLDAFEPSPPLEPLFCIFDQGGIHPLTPHSN